MASRGNEEIEITNHDLGLIETERFISVLLRGNIDYSK